MNLLRAIRRDLQKADAVRLRAVAERTGVPLTTVRRIVSGKTPNPGYETVVQLSRYRRWG